MLCSSSVCPTCCASPALNRAETSVADGAGWKRLFYGFAPVLPARWNASRPAAEMAHADSRREDDRPRRAVVRPHASRSANRDGERTRAKQSPQPDEPTSVRDSASSAKPGAAIPPGRARRLRPRSPGTEWEDRCRRYGDLRDFQSVERGADERLTHRPEMSVADGVRSIRLLDARVPRAQQT
jgi:hypothetical protein